MAIQRRTVVYQGPGGPFEGVAAWDDGADGPRPGVLVVPNILGQKEADNLVAERLAALGYVALAADLYGQGKRATRGPDQSIYMDQLNADRPLLLERLRASLAALSALEEADASRLAAIGYCFGGKCVLDLARSGARVAAVASFHGLYDRPPYPTATPMASKILVCHGWDDPLAPPEAVVGLGEELTGAGADWQLHAYGGAGHAFTDQNSPPQKGFGYNEAADRRSWAAMTALLAEVFG